MSRWLSFALAVLGIVFSNSSCQRGKNAQKPDIARTATPGPAKNADEAMERAVDYLWSKQAEDGGWHSEVYGGLRSGAATTSLVLYALASCPPGFVDDHREQLDRAVEFLEPGITSKGFVANQDGSPDYSNYATAMLLVANDRLELGLSGATQQRLVQYLLQAQIGPSHGYDSETPERGGWDLMGWVEPPKTTAGTNISVSRLAAEALVIYSHQDAVAQTLRELEHWLDGCSTRDGGYCFHPRQDHDGNKAGWHDEDREFAVSYGTATADGLRILQLLEVPIEDPRHSGAIEWLENHIAVADRVPGFEQNENPANWDQGLLWYYEFALSSTVEGLPPKTATVIADRVIRRLIQSQTSQGYWENESSQMREDDPLLATSFAVVSLSNLAPYE